MLTRTWSFRAEEKAWINFALSFPEIVHTHPGGLWRRQEWCCWWVKSIIQSMHVCEHVRVHVSVWIHVWYLYLIFLCVCARAPKGESSDLANETDPERESASVRFRKFRMSLCVLSFLCPYQTNPRLRCGDTVLYLPQHLELCKIVRKTFIH